MTVYGTTHTSTTVYGTTAAIVYGTTNGSGNTVIPYATLPSLSNGDDIAAWVESKHGVDQNGDGAFDIGVVTSNASPLTGIAPIGNDTTDWDAWEIFQYPNNGAAQVIGNTITYTPSAGYVGIDVIGYALIKDGAPVAMASIFVGVYGSQPPTAELPTYKTIEPITVFMDETTSISLSQFTNIGTVPFDHRLVQALDVDASIDQSLLILSPDTAIHGAGVGKVIIELVSKDGTTVYDRKIVTIQKVLNDSYVNARITLEINDQEVDSWEAEAYSPQKIIQQISGSYTGIAHDNDPVKVVVYVHRLDGNTTVTTTKIIGGVVIKEIV